MAAKAIRKIVRYSLIVLGVLVVVLLVAPFFIDVNDYKTRIEQEVEDATGRHLSIGAVQASLFPWVGVRLDDVHLANRSGFSGHDFLSVERLHVKLALLPLLNRELEIKQFEVASPKVYLERHSDGQNNWDDLVAA
ncbi:MAG: AsmA family protein, partial [Mariprofundaceae bacterium]